MPLPLIPDGHRAARIIAADVRRGDQLSTPVGWLPVTAVSSGEGRIWLELHTGTVLELAPSTTVDVCWRTPRHTADLARQGGRDGRWARRATRTAR